MNIIFAGTPEFAVPALSALIAAGHHIVMVLTQPDRPAGRGMQLRASPVKQLALQHQLKVFQPASLKPAEVQAQIEATHADVMIVAAYGLIIPTSVLAMPKQGCYNIHASLLPRWRGAAPIHRAILAGDAETGVTIMEVVPALDAGAMVIKGEIPILPTDTTQSLHDALSQLGAQLMVDAMHTLVKEGKLEATPQDEALVTYAHKLEKSESKIDWQQPAEALSRQVRAFNPFPVASTIFRGEVCKIWFATNRVGKGNSGEIVALGTQITVGCGDGFLDIAELQMPGAKRQTAQQFIQGQHVQLGEIFG
ncbi:MAG: methionyl-tRNA formyltransferase [Methylophilus sp.]|nr:methionyl-tRNA formyltransferase [Methylophilus sp.]